MVSPRSRVRQTANNRDSVLSERTFTFVVGEQKQEFHIHPSVTRGVSEPLYKLMTNGHMKESVSRTAFLPELEPTVFADFCRYSYHAISGSAPCLASRSELSNSMLPYDGLRYFFCRHCGSGCRSEDINRDFYPFCTGAQKNQNENTSYNSNHCAACGKDNMPGAKYQHGQPRCCDRCTKTQMTGTVLTSFPITTLTDAQKRKHSTYR